VDDNWFEAINNSGRNGIIPCNYVETIRLPVCKHLSSLGRIPALHLHDSFVLTFRLSHTDLHDRPPLCLQGTHLPPTRSEGNGNTVVGLASPTHPHPHHQFAQLSSSSFSTQHHPHPYPRSTGSTPAAALSYVQLKPIASQPNLAPSLASASHSFAASTATCSLNTQTVHVPSQSSSVSYAPQRAPPPFVGRLNGSIEPVGSVSLPSRKLYRVLYPYRPQQADELQLIAGDILSVTVHCEDGWFVGQSTLTGQCGTFPGNYVESLL
jgi:hypothetical protein